MTKTTTAFALPVHRIEPPRPACNGALRSAHATSASKKGSRLELNFSEIVSGDETTRTLTYDSAWRITGANDAPPVINRTCLCDNLDRNYSDA